MEYQVKTILIPKRKKLDIQVLVSVPSVPIQVEFNVEMKSSTPDVFYFEFSTKGKVYGRLLQHKDRSLIQGQLDSLPPVMKTIFEKFIFMVNMIMDNLEEKRERLDRKIHAQVFLDANDEWAKQIVSELKQLRDT